ncbi:MAG: DUF1801 domain-containing protein [Acidobacteria bacterium]|nr:DUF1801 domain-containing protein [Acidobacteriota bacterium]
MAENKTKATDQSAVKFLDTVQDPQRRQDCFTVLEMMKKATRSEPKMWGPNIVGFGTYRCKYESGRELDWFLTGFSPRKQNLTLYIMGGLDPHAGLLKKLGKFKTGKACLYLNGLKDIDLATLRKLIGQSIKLVRK